LKLTFIGSSDILFLIRQKMGNKEVEQYLTHLANEENVAPGTQKVVLNSVVFFIS
jgi:hypothetical protein